MFPFCSCECLCELYSVYFIQRDKHPQLTELDFFAKADKPPKFFYLLLEDSRVATAADFVQQHQDILKSLKERLLQAQNQQKKYADQNRIVRTFDVGDIVYLRLQPYRQTT